MIKPRKPSKYSTQFDREIARLNKIIKQAENQGITFIKSPVPDKPKRVTKQAVEKIHAITASEIKSKGFKMSESGVLEEFKPEKQSRKRKPFYELTPEEKKKRRSAAAKKGWKTRRKNQPKKRKKKKLTPEQQHKKRSEAAKKAAETRKKKAALDPEYKKRLSEASKRNLQKANIVKTRKRAQLAIDVERANIDAGYELPPAGFIMLENIKDELGRAINVDIAAYLSDQIDQIIEEIGLAAFCDRIQEYIELYSNIVVVCFESKQEIVRQACDVVLYIIYDGDVPDYVRNNTRQLIKLGGYNFYKSPNR